MQQVVGQRGGGGILHPPEDEFGDEHLRVTAEGVFLPGDLFEHLQHLRGSLDAAERIFLAALGEKVAQLN